MHHRSLSQHGVAGYTAELLGAVVPLGRLSEQGYLDLTTLKRIHVSISVPVNLARWQEVNYYHISQSPALSTGTDDDNWPLNRSGYLHLI